MHNIKQPLLISLLVCTVTSLFAGAQPLFTFDPTTPTTIRVIAGEIAPAQYRLTNQMSRPQTLTLYPTPGITQVTTGTGACSNPFYLEPNQSCLLNLAINGDLAPTILTPQVCKADANNHPDPFLCARSSQANSLNIQVNTNPTYAYLTSSSSNNLLYTCGISFTGSLINCTTPTLGVTLNSPKGLVINPTQTRLYIANQGQNEIDQCDIDKPTGVLSNCTNSLANTGSGGIDAPKGMAINPAGTIVYITNQGSNEITKCPVNAITGQFDNNCTLASNNPALITPEDITISPDNRFAYVPNQIGIPAELYQFDIDPSGSLSNAVLVGQILTDSFKGISLNTQGSMLYLSTASDTTTPVPTIYQCPITAGSVGTCTQSASFSGTIGTTPRGIAINSAGNFVYVLSEEPVGTPYAQCSVGTDGLVTTCENPTSTPTETYGIALLE
ncbi:MAG: YncE family protein [Legionellaceae bacterium]|nr:YncE family protein [Legionellaceae bacterium]